MSSIFTEFEDSDPAPGAAAPDLEQLRSNLAGARSIVCLASPRGGVGKSALTVNIAAALALDGRKVAILDADLNSPSIAAMLGMRQTRAYLTAGPIEPSSGPLGLRVISSDLLATRGPAPISFADDDSQPQSAAAPSLNGTMPEELGYTDALCTLLSATRLGALDMLLIDAATGLEHLCRIADLFAPTGFVLVTHPSELAVAALRDTIEVVGKGGAPILGIVENMAGFYCGNCHGARPLMPQGDVTGMAQQAGLPILARLPFDPLLAESCDRGVPFVRKSADAPLAKSLRELAHRLEELNAAAKRAAASRTA